MKQLSVTFPGLQANTRQIELQTADAMLAIVPLGLIGRLSPVILDWGERELLHALDRILDWGSGRHWKHLFKP